MKKILIPTRLDPVARTLLESRGYAVVQDDKTPVGELAAAHPDAFALIVRSEKVGADLMAALPNLKLVVRAGAGYNTIDIRAARKRGIDVMNTPGANANAVAEEVVALLLADARHLLAADASCRRGDWEKKAFVGRELAGTTVGIVGLGAIGRLVARRLSGFDCALLGHDPMLSGDRAEELGVEMTDLPELFRRSDRVTLHLPENDETRGSINGRLFALMKPGATLVNCARAGLLHEEDFRKARAEKGLRLLVDVYPKDEPGPKSVADVADIMLPHLGASTIEAGLAAARRAAEQLIEWDDKGIASFVVNRDIPEGLDPVYGELAYLLARLAHALLGRSAQLRAVETSFYGTLQPYAKWLLVPAVSALSDEFDRSAGESGARRFLQECGIEHTDRATDQKKAFPNSLTIDLIASLDAGTLRRVSVRGTVVEGRVMVSRINDFDRLYFDPKGNNVLFTYDDRPGVLGRIGAALAAEGINIDDVRNPHDPTGRMSLAMMQVSRLPEPAVLQAIAAEIRANCAVAVAL